MLSNEQLAALAVSILGTITAVARWAWVQGKKEAKNPPPAQCQCPTDMASKLDRIGWSVDEIRRDLDNINGRLK